MYDYFFLLIGHTWRFVPGVSTTTRIDVVGAIPRVQQKEASTLWLKPRGFSARLRPLGFAAAFFFRNIVAKEKWWS